MRFFIRNLLLFLLFPSILFARNIDTTIIANGSPGPYCVSHQFIDTSTLKIFFKDTLAVPPWNWLIDQNSILFTTSIDSGIPIFISFSTDYYGLPKVYSLYPKVLFTPVDTSDTTVLSIKRSLSFNGDELLQVSGYKSIGVSIGSFGQVTIEQGLDIVIGGEIRPGTELNAHLSDEGSSLQGATKEISDFDMMYIALKDPIFDVKAGDQYVTWLSQGILHGNKKIKGLSATIHGDNWYAGGFGALSGGKYSVDNFKGHTGIQGPYSLSGNGESSFITPVSGTIKCWLNGKLLKEGEEFDFTVDYDFGSVTFTSKNLILSNDIVKIEYEYKIYDYQRIILGVTAGFSSGDSLLNINSVLWSESDNRDRPVDQSFSQDDKNVLKNSGDNSLQKSTNNADAVHPNDVAYEDALYPLYILESNTKDEPFFTHVRFNRLKPDSSKGFYHVWFSHVGAGAGEYDRSYSPYYKEFIYYYLGSGLGSYTPKIPIVTPKRVTAGEFALKLNHSLLKTDISVAGQEHDKNLFSSLDDNDNLGSSGRISFLAGKKRTDIQSLWVNGKFFGSSRYFEGDLLSAWEKFNDWNDSALSQSQGEKIIWETGTGATFFPGVSTQFTYGQNRFNSIINTDKFNNVTNLYYNDFLNLEYNGSFFRHDPDNSPEKSRIEELSTDIVLQNQKIRLMVHEKWRNNIVKTGNGLIGTGISYELTPWLLKQHVLVDKLKSGSSNAFTANDSGYQLEWNQSINRSILSTWNLESSTNYYRQVLRNQSTLSTFLIDIASDINSKSERFSSYQNYQSISERSTSFITVPIYTGKGLGTHMYDTTRSAGDTTLDRFIPHVPGDWTIEQREISDNESDARMRKTLLNITWAFDPPKSIDGILSDLRWEGTLFCEEYHDAEHTVFSSWIPGIQSLQYASKNSWSPYLRFSDCSYRQDIDWVHPENNNLSADLFISPSLRQIQSYRETSFETALSINYSTKKVDFNNKVHYLTLFHNDSSTSDFDIFNIGTEFLQQFKLNQLFGLYLQENIGIGGESVHGYSNEPFTLANQMYGQIKPGIQFHPGGTGWAEVSYTFSYVSIPGEHDYRIARGYNSGISHVLSAFLDLRIGKYFSIKGMYRGDIKKEIYNSLNDNQHIFSLEMKAFL